mmetsp:Transcript_52832/g.156060  ORF Transcript_52832/g.156060 Transcript_52832/m.156060 type:complete len:200 (-) Transcript_52832:2080-2679(-)
MVAVDHVDKDGIRRREKQQRQVAGEQAGLERVLRLVRVGLRACVGRPCDGYDHRSEYSEDDVRCPIRGRLCEAIDVRDRELRADRREEESELTQPDDTLPEGRVQREASTEIGDAKLQLPWHGGRDDTAAPRCRWRQLPQAFADASLEGTHTRVEASQEEELKDEQCARKCRTQHRGEWRWQRLRHPRFVDEDIIMFAA